MKCVTVVDIDEPHDFLHDLSAGFFVYLTIISESVNDFCCLLSRVATIKQTPCIVDKSSLEMH
jgi:hypothetical protein